VLRLNGAGVSRAGTGHVLNLISSDVRRFDDAAMAWFWLLFAPLELLVVLLVRDAAGAAGARAPRLPHALLPHAMLQCSPPPAACRRSQPLQPWHPRPPNALLCSAPGPAPLQMVSLEIGVVPALAGLGLLLALMPLQVSAAAGAAGAAAAAAAPLHPHPHPACPATRSSRTPCRNLARLRRPTWSSRSAPSGQRPRSARTSGWAQPQLLLLLLLLPHTGPAQPRLQDPAGRWAGCVPS
jgi:hypothetical protein